MYPKITIVTPNFNQEKFLEHTIQSILSQQYPNLEYIIIDGASTDRSVEIIKKYEPDLSYWISEPDQGMYKAIQKGFEKSTGEIMGWLNSDDLLHSGSLFTLAGIFTQIQEVDWLQGLPTQFDQEGRTVNVSNFRKWSKFQFYQGEFKWIQQESTFWRRSLWEKAGGALDSSLRYAGDLELWVRFFRFAKLYCTNALIGGFRVRPGEQLSSNIKAYLSEADQILKIEEKLIDDQESHILRKILFRKKAIAILSKLRVLNTNELKNKFLNSLYDFPPSVHYNHDTKVFYFKK